MMDKIELIDKAALLEMLPQICDELNGCSAPYNFDEHCVGCEVYMLHKMLTDMPTIDAQPVRRGEWEHGMKCTHCGQIDTSKPNFCPNCGADMRGENDEQT